MVMSPDDGRCWRLCGERTIMVSEYACANNSQKEYRAARVEPECAGLAAIWSYRRQI